MSDLVTFLQDRLDEDEADPGGWSATRVLAEVDAKRRIIAEHPILTAWKACTRCSDFAEHTSDLIRKVPGPCQTLRLLALPYAGHPDYRPEWAPDA